MRRFAMMALLALLLPALAAAITEPKTGTEYPDIVTMSTDAGDVTLEATGVALREKTFLKVDVYTIISYVASDLQLGDKPHEIIRTADVPKRIRMDLRRGFSREKLVNVFREVIEKNYPDLGTIQADMETFLAFFDRDAMEDDALVFSYDPAVGLTTELNGEVKGVQPNPQFTEALWTVWFGNKPADKGMRKSLSGGR